VGGNVLTLKMVQESRTKARSATHTPEEVLKKAVDDLTAKVQTLEQERVRLCQTISLILLSRFGLFCGTGYCMDCFGQSG
jgi:hypothetical protein